MLLTPRTSNTNNLLDLQIFYWSYTFFFNITRIKHCIKFTDNIDCFLFISSSFTSKTFGDILVGKLDNKNVPQRCTGPVGPVEVFFNRPKPFLGNFYCQPGTSSSLLAWSPVIRVEARDLEVPACFVFHFQVGIRSTTRSITHTFLCLKILV